MKAVQATSGLYGCDIATPVTAAQAAALYADGARWIGRYLGSLQEPELTGILAAGLKLLVIAGYARVGDWSASTGLSDASEAIARAHALGLPSGITIFLDLESSSGAMTPDAAIAYATAHAHAVQSTGDIAGLYAGAGCPLDGAQLYSLPHTAYAQACSDGYTVKCGWQWIQAHPGDLSLAGIQVDLGMLVEDYMGRLPWLVAGPP